MVIGPLHTGLNRKWLIMVFVLSAACIGALLVMLRKSRPSVVGRWHEVSGGEQMTFMRGGEMQVGDSMGSYTWIDAEHLRIDLGVMGSPRLVWFSPHTGVMQWTNHELGLVLRYTNEPGSFVRVRINEALGI